MSKNKTHASELGEVNGLAILLVVAVFIIVAVSGVAVWAWLGRNEAQSNLDAKINVAVAEARKQQVNEDNKEFAEREKVPYRQFVGPSELGRVQFDYPKTWSVYIDKAGSNGNFEAYFHPLTVQPVNSDTADALRLSVLPRDYDEVVRSYESKVKSGALRSEPVNIQGFPGLKLQGSFAKEAPEAVLIIFKIRDKTLQISSESPEYFPDFENIVLKSLNYND